MERSRSISAALGRSTFEKIPQDIGKKLEKLFEDASSRVIEMKTSHNVSQKTTGEYRKIIQVHRLLNSVSNITSNDQKYHVIGHDLCR